MKIDLLYEIQVPGPWTQNQREAEQRAYWNVVEQIEMADRMGFDTVWLVEHHFQRERAHSSAPEVFLGAISQRTKNIRIGHGVVLLPYPFNHPIRVAERAAVLDIMSNGRLEFGTGRSGAFEQEGFGIKPEETRALWREALEIIPKMWTQETFSYKGKYFTVPERNVLPKPMQQPHPPIWMAGNSDESYPLAGSLGIGVLGLTIMNDMETIDARVKSYREALKTAKPVGAYINNQVATYTLVHCADSQQKARENGAYDAVAWWLGLLVTTRRGWQGINSLQAAYKKYPVLQKFAEGEVGAEHFDHEDMVIIGDPDKVTRKMERYQQVGMDHVICDVHFGHLSQQAVLRNIELLGKHVIPHFKKVPAAV